MSMEEGFDAILGDETLSKDAKLLALGKLILKHKPKNNRGWAPLLRRIADYIDSLPEHVELSSKAIAGLIELDEMRRERG
jgi:hypothetical protein